MEPTGSKENLDIVECGKLFQDWTEEKQNSAKNRLWKEFGLFRFLDENGYGDCDTITDHEYKFLTDVFNVREHFEKSLSHKKFILKSFTRFESFFESIHLKREQLEIHDDSKLTSFLEIIGCTQRWIWNTNTDIWGDALKHHYHTNSHHPQYYQSVSENGEVIQENMKYLDIVESVIDMLACHWERKLNGKENVENKDLLDIDEFFLKRYTDHDKIQVKTLLTQLMNIQTKKLVQDNTCQLYGK